MPTFDPVSKKNHGIEKSSAGGTKFMEPYGKDDSDVVGSAMMERNPHKMGGSITNLAHSLSGTSANQKGS
jgi:hypothetical protein